MDSIPLLRTRVTLDLTVNGEAVTVSCPEWRTLLEVLREDLHLAGTRHGCELGECGACTVLLDGEPVPSCLVLAVECEGHQVETVEGLAVAGELTPLQQAFAAHGGSQCGYCTPGMLMSLEGLRRVEPDPSPDEIRAAISGNLCRCTGYSAILRAAEAGFRESRAEAAEDG